MFGRFKVFSFTRRPDINEQNTGHEVYNKPFGYGFTDVKGIAGVTVLHSPSPFNPGTVMVGPTHRVVDPTVTGNNSSDLKLLPLSDPMQNLIGSLTTGNI